MIDRHESIRSSVMRSIADDYEEFETIVQDAIKFAADLKVDITRDEISLALKQLVEEGYAQAYVFSTEAPYSPKPVAAFPDKIPGHWFFLSPKGIEALRDAYG
jgi:ABC-type branched-subunit amino acid transport system substrate-binding protein